MHARLCKFTSGSRRSSSRRPILRSLSGKLSCDDEMRRRRRPEVGFAQIRVLRMSPFASRCVFQPGSLGPFSTLSSRRKDRGNEVGVFSSSTVRRRRNL